jgi:PadR family transcriptional regulator PadR
VRNPVRTAGAANQRRRSLASRLLSRIIFGVEEGRRREAPVFSAEMKKGSLELIVLTLVGERPRHGYEIGKLIEARSRGQLQFRVTSLYPVLYRMENRGWITSRWVEKAGEQRRNYYSLTPRGRQVLSEEQRRWKAFTAAVDLVVGGERA